MSVFDTFVKKHDFLVCVDSDGCAMDTMNCKHFHCFGPCMVDEWALDEWREPILKRWNEINLFQMYLPKGVCVYEADDDYTIDTHAALNGYISVSPLTIIRTDMEIYNKLTYLNP